MDRLVGHYVTGVLAAASTRRTPVLVFGKRGNHDVD